MSTRPRSLARRISFYLHKSMTMATEVRTAQSASSPDETGKPYTHLCRIEARHKTLKIHYLVNIIIDGVAIPSQQRDTDKQDDGSHKGQKPGVHAVG